ncbi:Mrp/NBP35 family ATP-binding protein [Magnetofaba australis]|uniref:Iron-sulfur cluster carrier protein n=1 Tax=Magnetofaba australis IT-1 TaxID=1434232 RepID=A0A1Y2K4B6_9PROT|nr:Mrp/NBP35 family ATP-binding protein [Magnetofaba australis]OSM01885.1 putative ATP-binding protein involved in chromosome partitioning [Magnetofaba australis IT-1]
MNSVQSNHDAAVQRITAIFDQVREPKLNWSIAMLNLLKEVRVDDDGAHVALNLVCDEEPKIAAFRAEALAAIASVYDGSVELEIGHVRVAEQGVAGVGHILLVASGKGGVGKSTVAVNLAAALSAQGLKVGLLDADITGPSVPTMLGQHGRPETVTDEQLMPVMAHGLKFLSVGSLIAPGQALDWRGQMISGTIAQMARKTVWGKLDVLVVDMPPGTGDVHLTLASTVRASGAVVVTTPQEVAWSDVRRALDQLQRQKIPVLGVVENMSLFACEACGHHNHPFPQAQRTAPPEMEMLAHLPLDAGAARDADSGQPAVLAHPESDYARAFTDLAHRIWEKLNLSPTTNPIAKAAQEANSSA